MNINRQPDVEVKKTSQKYFTQPKDFVMLVIGVLSVIYVLNITFGLVEFLPDNLPFIGNIDEAVVTTVLISVLQYFDINPVGFFNRN